MSRACSAGYSFELEVAMRRLSDFEREVIRDITRMGRSPGSLVILENLTSRMMGGPDWPETCYVEFDSTGRYTFFVRTDSDAASGSVQFGDLVGRVTSTLLGLVELFEYLDSNKLVYFVGDYDARRIGEKIGSSEDYMECGLLSKDVVGRIYPYARKRIFVSEMLREVVANGFRSEEDMRHEQRLVAARRELNYTRIALAIVYVASFSETHRPHI